MGMEENDMEQERIDEALELLWVLDEDARHDQKHFRLGSDDSGH